MKMKSLLGGVVGLTILAALAVGCRTQRPYIRPSKQVQRDFYTCQDFDSSGMPVGVTSEFSLEKDNLIYIVADLEPGQVGNRLDFEVSSPLGKISFVETVEDMQDRPYGFYFDTNKLYDRGKGGKWKVLFWANGEPMGRLYFNLIGPDMYDEEAAGASQSSIFEDLFGEAARPQVPSAPEDATQEMQLTPETPESEAPPVESEVKTEPKEDAEVDAEVKEMIHGPAKTVSKPVE